MKVDIRHLFVNMDRIYCSVGDGKHIDITGALEMICAGGAFTIRFRASATGDSKLRAATSPECHLFPYRPKSRPRKTLNGILATDTP